MNTIKKYWHWILIGGIFFLEALIMLILNKNIYVGICDNLDLFITQLKMLKDNDAFFVQDQMMPILKGIDREYFPTELSLYNLLYLILPDVYAYIAGYILRLIIALSSCVLLGRYLLKDKFKEYERLIVLVAGAFSLLPLYPMYSICFASIPLVLYLLIRIHTENKIWLYVLLFMYPFVSYFTFFGAFILGYILIAALVLGIKERRFPKELVISFFVLFAGYACFEYRLFGIMLFSEEETIRSTMVIASYGIKDLLRTFADVFVNGFSHAKSVHTYFVLPVCIIYFIYNNYKYIKTRAYKEIFKDYFNITMMFIVFNCVVYALYYWEPLRKLVELVLPPLKGFQYGRTIFFNAFAWYFAFVIVLMQIYKKKQMIACVMALISIVLVGSTQCEYSDFYNTVYCNVYKLVKNTEVNQLSYGEFFGTDLFSEIKEDIDYKPEQEVCAYGFHPAALSYNGISTIDGYCGYYTQDYKESFRSVIEPVLEQNDKWKSYYDDWGCRAYLFPASGENIYDFGANSESVPQEININIESLKDIGCDYIFSRIEITNAKETGLFLVDEFAHENVPYKIFVYSTF